VRSIPTARGWAAEITEPWFDDVTSIRDESGRAPIFMQRVQQLRQSCFNDKFLKRSRLLRLSAICVV
jgi:hypothetical protein